jgi:hypothetical protein
MMSNFFKTKHHKGFALLFSIVVVSVVVITTLAVSSIVRRGLEITSVGERSMEAFFAADAGLECALYWDIKERPQNKFRSSPGPISCLGFSIPVTGVGSIASFSIKDSARDVCADVTVSINGLNTTVSSRGYNTCISDRRRVERGLEASY